MLDKLFFIILVMNVTGLFRFLAPQFDVEIGQVSLVLLIFNLLYILVRLSYLIPMFPKMLPWFVVLIAWPLATLAYAPTIELREIGLAVYRFTLFSGAVIFSASNGLSAIRRVFLVSLVLTVFGQVLNMGMPGYFETVAALADARVLSMGRAGGFFMQPNSLAIGLAFLFIGWLALARRDTVLREPIIIVAFLGSELLTGSRTGMVLGVVIVGVHLVYQWRARIFRSRKVRYLSARLAVLVVCVFFGLIGMKFFVEIYGRQIDRDPGDLIDRMNTLLELNLSGHEELAYDTSFQKRFSAQRVYWSLIKEKTFIGHGFGAEVFYLRNGTIHLTAHSTMLSVTMEYGVIYLLAFSLLLAMMFLNRHRGPVEQALGTNVITQFVLVTLLTFVIGGGLLVERAFFVVFGMVYTAAYYPWRVFACDASTRTYTGMLSRDEIRQAQRNRVRNSRLEAADGAETEAVDAKSDEATTT